MPHALTLLRANPQLRRLWFAEVISLGGDWLSFVAISLLALDQRHGALALATVLVLHTLPHALLAPIAGLLADRLDARRWMRAAALVEAALTLGLVWAAHAGALLWVQVLVGLRASVSAAAYPTWGVALRGVTPDTDLVRANALNAATWSVMFSLGMAAGGVLSLLGPELALGIDALSFVLTALLLGGLPRLPPPEHGQTRSLRAALRDSFGALPTALAEVRSDAVLLEASAAKALISFAGAGVWLLIHLRATALTGAATAGLGLGLLHALRGVGTGVGPAAVATWLATPTVRVLRLGQAVTAGGLALAALSPWPALALLGVLLWGVGTGANWTLSSSLLQLHARRAVLGRVSALDSALRTAALSVAVLAAAAAVEAGAAVSAAAVATLLGGVGLWAAARLWAARAPVQPRVAAAYPRTIAE